MRPDRWNQVESLYLAALDAPDRVAFLEEACLGDTELRTLVESLLDQEPTTVAVFERLVGPGVNGLPQPRRVLAPGSAFGPYEIVELVGSGGSADVYRASDPRLARSVALKVFTRAALTAEIRAKFEREARAAAALNHPNIATIYEVGEVDGSCYIAMEYVDGPTLRERLYDPGCVLVERLRHLVQVARALERAHSKGVIHCDLKPDNVVLSIDGLVKILDFGIAQLVQGSRVAPTLEGIEGTVGYMSPEQVSGLPLDARSDIFSFGCILFEAAANRTPFWDESVIITLQRVSSADAPPISTVLPGPPPGLEPLVAGCLARDPALRWQSMREVRQQLEVIVAWFDERRRRVQARWRRAVAAVAAAAAVAVAAAWPSITRPPAEALAVMPFVNVQQTAEGDYLSYRISESLITTFGQISGVKVIAHSSSSQYAGTTLSDREIARTLGARALLKGRIDETNGQVAVTAELVSGSDGTRLWSARYDTSVADVSHVEMQIAREIASRLDADSASSNQQRLDRTISADNTAYEALLRGRYEMWLYNPGSTERAIERFKGAIADDPSYALAYAELANAYRRRGSAGIVEPSEPLRLAEEAARRALALDRDLVQARTALADIMRDQWRWGAALQEYREAIRRNPRYIPAQQGLAIALSVMGLQDEAVAQNLIARELTQELDPVGVSSMIEFAAVFYNVRRYDRALDILDSAMTTTDEFAPALQTWIGIVEGGRGRFAAAVDALDRARQRGDTTTATTCYRIYALGRLQRADEAWRLLRAIESNRDKEYVPPSSHALAYVGLGEHQRALELLEAAFLARDPLLQYIAVEPHFDPIRNDERFRRIVAGLHIPGTPRAPDV